MPSPNEIYTSRLDAFEKQLALLKKKAALVAFFRLLFFLAIATVVYLMLQDYQPMLWLPLSGSIMAFIAFIRRSISLTEQKQLTAAQISVNKNELNLLDDKPNLFADGSHTVSPAMHADDLDLFGPRSLYALINRSTTLHGMQALAGMFNHPELNVGAINDRQSAIRHFAPQVDIRQLITAHSLLGGVEGKIEDVILWLNTPDRMANRAWLNIIRYLVPTIALAALLYFMSTNQRAPLAAAVLINWFVVALFMKHAWEQHLLAGKKEAVLTQYATILKIFNNVDGANSVLLQRLRSVSEQAAMEIARLSRLTSMLDQRLNFFVNIVGNSLIQYDVHCLVALEKWKIKNRAHFAEWIKVAGEIEALNSLSTFAFNNPKYTYPVASAERPFLNAVEMVHPMIRHGVQIANSVAIGRHNQQLLLITGSNMSGKSTFLRTLGINLLLAQCGAPVCAARFEYAPMRILSSVRISDSLQDNTSYFMAELKRLHSIIGQLSDGEPALVLIDEVLRGTNSDDKTHGSEALIKKLLNFNCLALFATHDLSLSVLENKLPDEVVNYCFESVIVNDELSFDYSLRKGVATNKNATFLMQQMGII